MIKIITLILVFAIVALSSGCTDSGTMNKYDSYIQVYNNDMDEYNFVMDELIKKQNNYNTAYQDTLDANEKPYAHHRSVSTGQTSYERSVSKLNDALGNLEFAKDNYEFTANIVYTHLDEFESFVISNEDTLERNGVDIVQLKADIQDWKEEIRYMSF
jgi:hypothetical protein